MKLITVHEQEEGQKLLKLLGSYLKEASGGFLHKMLRKKNITLNGKKADGSEKLKARKHWTTSIFGASCSSAISTM